MQKSCSKALKLKLTGWPDRVLGNHAGKLDRQINRRALCVWVRHKDTDGKLV
jgi:hypothetical protein